MYHILTVCTLILRDTKRLNISSLLGFFENALYYNISITLRIRSENEWYSARTHLNLTQKDFKKMVKHIILWKLKGDLSAPETVKAGIKAGLEGLQGVIPGLVEIKVQTQGLPSSNADVMGAEGLRDTPSTCRSG